MTRSAVTMQVQEFRRRRSRGVCERPHRRRPAAGSTIRTDPSSTADRAHPSCPEMEPLSAIQRRSWATPPPDLNPRRNYQRDH